jgi:hypothetical protein
VVLQPKLSYNFVNIFLIEPTASKQANKHQKKKKKKKKMGAGNRVKLLIIIDEILI